MHLLSLLWRVLVTEDHLVTVVKFDQRGIPVNL